ncbi:hypothetical protein BC829DRAFT_64735 [Chytridium lagenaria]|nr:hypothetical protein BC829DRAFT_64735 [Chytridium lagenaria]
MNSSTSILETLLCMEGGVTVANESRKQNHDITEAPHCSEETLVAESSSHLVTSAPNEIQLGYFPNMRANKRYPRSPRKTSEYAILSQEDFDCKRYFWSWMGNMQEYLPGHNLLAFRAKLVCVMDTMRLDQSDIEDYDYIFQHCKRVARGDVLDHAISLQVYRSLKRAGDLFPVPLAGALVACYENWETNFSEPKFIERFEYFLRRFLRFDDNRDYYSRQLRRILCIALKNGRTPHDILAHPRPDILDHLVLCMMKHFEIAIGMMPWRYQREEVGAMKERVKTVFWDIFVERVD